jgi:hypothetical protein
VSSSVPAGKVAYSFPSHAAASGSSIRLYISTGPAKHKTKKSGGASHNKHRVSVNRGGHAPPGRGRGH